jgi:hypothetical protein
VPEVKIGRRRIHPELDSKRTPQRELRREFDMRNNLDRPSTKRFSRYS